MTSLGLNRSRVIWIVVALIVVATALPVVLSLLLARDQAAVDQARRATIYATDVLRRSEGAGDQISAAFRRLARTPGIDSCDADARTVLQGIDATSSYVQSVGVLRGNALYCSSYGVLDPPIDLGPIDYVTATGARIRRNVHLPFAPTQSFIVLDNGHFAAVVHKLLPVDSTVTDPGVSLAVVSLSNGEFLATRGRFDPAWTRDAARLKPGQHRTFIVRGRTVAQYRSAKFDLLAIASLDPSNYNGAVARVARVLVPLGILLGMLMAYATHRTARAQMTPAAAIRSGLQRGEFFPVFQPIVSLADRRWVGAEVLLRWRRADQLVRPDLFIPAAEDGGLIGAVTKRVLELVEPTLAQLATRDDDFFLSINLSPDDMHREETLDLLRQLLQRTGARPGQVHVEVTERAFANTIAARDMVRRMRALGLQVSIDDFGTGYSSLAELTTFELDTLKIDKAFVDTVGGDAVTSHVAFHIVEMARGLSLGMVAEGVEQERQATILTEWRVPYGQGWLFSRPLPADEFLEKLRDVARADAAVDAD
ncbi:EAL domain-containing protein [Lysobacter claricitrinus]|uniref:EAL domain-containing protein n=1 Tax=Lysobacter claricitrinus TaxID=3367728 RepID=UPI0037DBEB49